MSLTGVWFDCERGKLIKFSGFVGTRRSCLPLEYYQFDPFWGALTIGMINEKTEL